MTHNYNLQEAFFHALTPNYAGKVILQLTSPDKAVGEKWNEFQAGPLCVAGGELCLLADCSQLVSLGWGAVNYSSDKLTFPQYKW